MPSAWVTHVKSYYQARKKKQKDYKYSSAISESNRTLELRASPERYVASPPF